MASLRRYPSAPAPAISRRCQSPGYRAKKLLLGPALETAQLTSERVSKRVALAVFSSDPISSTAYATEEILLVLVGATVAGGALATELAAGDLGPISYPAGQASLLHFEGAPGVVTVFLILRAFASGTRLHAVSGT